VEQSVGGITQGEHDGRSDRRVGPSWTIGSSGIKKVIVLAASLFRE
jgi:hypothetical protein